MQKWNSLLIKYIFKNDYKNYQVHGEADITGICLRLLEAFGGVSCASNVVCSSRPILIYYNSYMAARLGGIKDEKSSWGSEMDNTFLFYFPKMQSHVWISTSIESGLSNCRYIKPYIKFKLLKLAFFINQQFVEKMQNRFFFRILYCQCQNQLSKAKTHSNVFFSLIWFVLVFWKSKP